jgi:hypothetical protein
MYMAGWLLVDILELSQDVGAKGIGDVVEQVQEGAVMGGCCLQARASKKNVVVD